VNHVSVGHERWSLRRILTPAGLADPYAIYDELREAKAAGFDIGRTVLSAADVATVMADRTMSSDRIPSVCRVLDHAVRTEVAMVERTISDIVAFRDPPDHTRVRRLLAAAFTPKVLARERSIVEVTAERALDALDGRRDADLFTEVLFPFPSMVVAGILGIPEDDRPRFVRWALQMVLFVGSGRLDSAIARETLAEFTEMRSYFVQLVAHRRAEPGEDLLSAMLTATDAESEVCLTDDEVIANALFLMVAGHETAANQLGNAIVTLLRHPEQLALLRSDPDVIDQATEELLRFEPAVQMTARIATRTTETAGIALDPGQSVTVVLAAANRDPAVHHEPHRFDITRPPVRHMAFGHGAHWCLGGNLARQELHVMLPRIIERMPNLALVDDEIAWQATLNFRGPTKLAVRW
jgi:pimeloyl-[acyl-carrier protein] synthase